MEKYDELLEKYENKHFKKNAQIAKLMVDEICNEMKTSMPSDISKLNYLRQLGAYLHFIDVNFKYNDSYIDYLYELYNKYNYNINEDIKNAMTLLRKYDEHDYNITNKILKSPIIDDVVNNKNEYQLITSKLGNINVFRANNYFFDNIYLSHYMKYNKTSNMCHKNSEMVSKNNPDFESVVSLCKLYFKGRYFHSYNVNNDIVADLCFNAIIDKDTYYKIMNPKEIINLPYSDIESKLREANRHILNDQYYSLIKIGLYETLKKEKVLKK